MTTKRRYGRRAAAALCLASALAGPQISAARQQSQEQAAATAGHSTRIVLLGTKAGPGLIATRSETAVLLLVDGQPYLIDAGTGTARQIVRAGYQVASISTIFVTHAHLDHTGGLASVVSNIAEHEQFIGSGQKSTPLTVIGPPSTKILVNASLQFAIVHDRLFRADMPAIAPFDPKLFDAREITHGGLVFKDSRITVTAVENTHFRHPSYGPGGVKDMSFSYRFDTPAGSVVFTGDTGPSAAVTKLATGADVLVSEVYQPYIGSMPADSKAPSPQEKERTEELQTHMETEHLTPEGVGKMAAQAHVKAVILYHIAAEYDEKNFAAMQAGVQRWFHGQLVIGNDFTAFDMRDGQYAVDYSAVPE